MELPNEILVHILSFLQDFDLLRCATVSKLWSRICLKEMELWRKICEKNNYTLFWVEQSQRDSTLVNWFEIWRWYRSCEQNTFDPAENKEGCGNVLWPNKTRYTGEFFQNKKHGRGKHEWPDSSRYEGEWKDDSRNGFGTYFWADGRYFIGYHSADRRTFGSFYWPPQKSEKIGARYVGEYKSSLRHGQGIFYWPDGDYFEGEWSNGGRHGEGKYYCHADTAVYRQNWNEANFDYFCKGEKLERISKRKFGGEISWREIPDELKSRYFTPPSFRAAEIIDLEIGQEGTPNSQNEIIGNEDGDDEIDIQLPKRVKTTESQL